MPSTPLVSCVPSASAILSWSIQLVKVGEPSTANTCSVADITGTEYGQPHHIVTVLTELANKLLDLCDEVDDQDFHGNW